MKNYKKKRGRRVSKNLHGEVRIDELAVCIDRARSEGRHVGTANKGEKEERGVGCDDSRKYKTK